MNELEWVLRTGMNPSISECPSQMKTLNQFHWPTHNEWVEEQTVFAFNVNIFSVQFDKKIDKISQWFTSFIELYVVVRCWCWWLRVVRYGWYLLLEHLHSQDELSHSVTVTRITSPVNHDHDQDDDHLLHHQHHHLQCRQWCSCWPQQCYAGWGDGELLCCSEG